MAYLLRSFQTSALHRRCRGNDLLQVWDLGVFLPVHHELLTSLDCARVLHHGHLDGDLVDQLVGFVVGAQVRSHLHVGLVWLLSCLDQPEGRDHALGALWVRLWRRKARHQPKRKAAFWASHELSQKLCARLLQLGADAGGHGHQDQLVGRKVLGRNHIFERFSLDGQVLQGVQVLELFLQQRSSDLALEIQHSKLHMAANPVLPVLLQVPVGQN